MTGSAGRRIGLRHILLILAVLLAGLMMAQQSGQAQSTDTLRFVCSNRLGQLYVVGNTSSCPTGYKRISLTSTSPALTVCLNPPSNTARSNVLIPCLWFETTVVLHGPTELFACTNRPLNRPFTERLRIAYDSGGCPRGDYVLRILPGNPTAANDSYVTAFETSLTVLPPGVLANDSVNSGTLSSFDSVSSNAGSVSVTADGGFTYTPPTGFTGEDSFGYTVTNAAGSSSATVTIQVMYLPVAVDDEFTIGGSGTIQAPGVLANDEINGATIIAYDASTSAGGSVLLYTDGSFTYTEPLAQATTDSFTYTISNPVGSSTATVTLNLNQAPVATDNAYTVDEDTTLNIAAPGVLTNDADPDGDPLIAVKLSDPSHGIVTLNNDGSFSYTPADDYNGPDSFTYETRDDRGGQSNTATVNITIDPVNDTPTADGQTTNIVEDTPTTITLTGNDIDGDGLTFSIDTYPSHGSLSSIGTPNCVTGACSATYSYSPDPNYNGPDSFTFTVTDGTVSSTQATVSITVDPVNDAPVAVDDTYDSDGVSPLTVLTPGVLGNDTDIEGNLLTAALVSNVTGGTLTLNADGSFTYMADAGTTSDSFTYRANDGLADSNVATVTIAVNAVPVANSSSVTTNEDTPVLITLTGSDADDEDLTFAIGSAPTTGTLGAISAVDCSAVNTCSATVSYSPNANANGTDSFTFTTNDGIVTSTAATVTITIDAVNDVPSFTVGPDQTELEDSGATTDAGWATSISAGPTTDEDSQSLTFTVTADVPSLFSIQPDIDEATGDLTYTFASNAFGTTTVTVTLKDDGGTAMGGDDTSDAQTFTITVIPINDPPIFTPGTNVTVGEDSGAYSDTWATALSVGPNESGQLLTFVVTNDNNSLFSDQPAISSSGTLTFTPAANMNGTATVSVTLTDDGGTANGGDDQSEEQTFTITITPVNDPPVALAKTYTAQTNMRLSIDGSIQSGGLLAGASDPDSNDSGFASVLTIGTVSTTTPAGGIASVNTTTGSIDFDPPPGVTGDVTFTYTVCDNGNPTPSLCSAAQTVTITISGPVIWFVDPNAATNGNGTLASPFKFLSGNAGTNNDADDVDAANHRIFIHSGTVAAGITLNPSEWLIGQGATSSPAGSFDALFEISPPQGTMTRPSIHGSRPTIIPISGTAVTLGTDNRLQGFNVNAPAGIAGGDVNALIVNQVGITSTSGTAFNIAGGTAQMNVVLDSVTASAGANPGVRAVNNTMGSIAITGASNTLNTTTGTGLEITNTTIAPAGLTFRSISVNGAPNGIVLINTGSSAGLTVTGNGGDCTLTTPTCTGGTINGTVGANGATSGIGIYLSSTQNISLTNMRINGTHGNYGIRGISVTTFSMINLLMDGSFGNWESLSDAEGAVVFNNLLGTSTIASSHVRNGFTDNIRVINDTGSATVNITSATIRDNDALACGGTGCGNDGLNVEALNAANVTLSVTGSTFIGHKGDHVNVLPQGSGTVDVTLDNNAFTGGHPSVLGGGITFLTGNSFSGLLDYTVSDNTISGTFAGGAMHFNKGVSSNGTLRGTVSGNTIGIQGVLGSGCDNFCSGLRLEAHGGGAHIVHVLSNTIHGYEQSGIDVIAGEDSSTVAFDVTIGGNTITTPDPDLALAGIYVDIGITSTPTPDAVQSCIDIGGIGGSNNLVGSGGIFGSDVWLLVNQSSVIRLPGYTGASNGVDIPAYIQGRNSGGPSVYASTNQSGTFGNTPSGASCAAP